MKIIHTGDWHLGQLFYRNDREEEHQYFFAQLEKIIREEKPDALVISGDIFHTATPSIASQRLYYNTLAKLSRLDDDLQIIVVSGNHDSPSRLEAVRDLWEAFHVSVVGMIDYKQVGEDRVIDYHKFFVPVTRADKVIGWVLAVPFINPGNYPPVEQNDSYANRVFHFYNSLSEKLVDEGYENGQAVVATGHFYVGGSEVKGQDNIVVGGLEGVSAKTLASVKNIDYWALGHIHKPQHVFMNQMRYSGSPLAVSFDENYEHSVALVEIENKETKVTKIPIQQLIPVMDFPSKPKAYDDALSFDDVMLQLNMAAFTRCYVRVFVKVEGQLTPGQTHDIIEQITNKGGIACGIIPIHPVRQVDNEAQNVNNLQELKALSPFDMGCEAYRKKTQTEMPEDMKKEFEDICECVKAKGKDVK